MKYKKRPVNGIVLLDKPQGLSSHQALQQVKHLLQAEKAGHTGSLDPMATGLLPLCFGEATKFASVGLEADKTYIARMQLGVVTTTGDAEGEVTQSAAVPNITSQNLQKIEHDFLGEQLQIPPMYSALKQEGVALYKLARAGKTVERKARAIHIYALSLKLLDNDIVEFQVHCSKGTYVRVLAFDMARALGTIGAHLIYLRRIALGTLTGPMMRLAESSLESTEKCLLPIDALLQALPCVILDEVQSLALLQGKSIVCENVSCFGVVRLYTQEHIFLGVARLDVSGMLQDKRLVSMTYYLGCSRT